MARTNNNKHNNFWYRYACYSHYRNCTNISDLSKLSTKYIHTIIYYDDYLIIIMNGGKGLVTAENIPLKSIENSLNIDIPGTFSGSSVCQPAPPDEMPTVF